MKSVYPPNDSSLHEKWMHEAIEAGRDGLRAKGGPFGAVVVCEGRVIGRGCNLVTQSLDPTAHAEILAIRKACRTLGRFDLRGCALYASCEPCPMCLAAIYWARLERIFYGATRSDAAQAGFDDSFIYEQIPLELSARTIPMQQTCAEAARTLFREWEAKPDKVPY